MNSQVPGGMPAGSMPGGQAGFCGVPGQDLAAMAQAAWGSMDGTSAPQQAGMQAGMAGGMPAGMQAGMAASLLGEQSMSAQAAAAAMGGQMGGQMPEQASISLSAQAELELELSLRGSLLVQQQRRIVQLEDELQRAWAEIDRLRTKIAAAERDRQRTDDDSSKQASTLGWPRRSRRCPFVSHHPARLAPPLHAHCNLACNTTLLSCLLPPLARCPTAPYAPSALICRFVCA